MKYIVLIPFLIIYTWVQAQTVIPHKIEKKLELIPDSILHNTASLARFFKSQFNKPEDITEALYYWITRNYAYDVDQLKLKTTYKNTAEMVDKILKTRKGVCMQYSLLYSEIANLAGVKTEVITGYTKRGTAVDQISHAWCAFQINKTWYLADPTWGAGYVQFGKFHRQLNNDYYKVSPQEFIKTHMPFDPMWQFLNYPNTYTEFNSNKILPEKYKKFFSFNDTITAYELLTEREQLFAEFRRIENNGQINSLVKERQDYLVRKKEYFDHKSNTDYYNTAINYYNVGISKLNQLITYRNNQFNPQKEEKELRTMIAETSDSFNQSETELDRISDPGKNLQNQVNKMHQNILQAKKKLNEQNTAVTKYLRTRKNKH